MKLDPKTVAVLSNFATVNPSIIFHGGGELRCISPGKTILGKARVPNDFPKRCAFYELPKFLGILSLFENPDLDFQDNVVVITEADGSKSVKYHYTEERLVTQDADKDVNLASVDVELALSHKVLVGAIKAAGVLQSSAIAFVGDGQDVYLQTMKPKEENGNYFRHKVGTTDKKFTCIYKIENLMKIMSGDYQVQISRKGISYFKGDTVEYWILVESSSSYDF